jgi:hypothetical protein
VPTIVYFVHGMGCGTPTGSAPPAGESWTDSLGEALGWIAQTYRLPRFTVLDPIPSAPPGGSAAPDAVWVVPISYHEAFDEFRRGALNRRDAVSGIGANLTDAHITALTDTDFAWTNCLDVLLWWADTAQARKLTTTKILTAITKADQLARSVGGATIRRIMVSHSLGNAVVAFALRHLATNPAWLGIGGFESWFALANVAPFLIDPTDVYSLPLLPGQSQSIVQGMTVAGHEADPIPWLLPWRHWGVDRAPKDIAKAWADQVTAGNVLSITNSGVVAAPNRKPDITAVHGFVNYLVSPDVSRRLAASIRGGAFTDAEIGVLAPVTAWKALPQLTCQGKPSALADLQQTTDAYIKELQMPNDVTKQADGWLQRLLRAADLLTAARSTC